MVIVKNLVKVAKLNIGITAMGDMELEDNDWDFSSKFQFGYGTIPSILKAHADKTIAKIEVSKELQAFLDTARRSYGNYQNALRLWHNALEQRRKAQIAIHDLLKKVISDPTSFNPLLLLTIKTLYSSELNLNDAIHDAWKARAQMDRFLRNDESKVMRYLPKNLDIDSAIEDLEHFLYQENWESEEVQELVQSIRKTADLKSFLGGGFQMKSGFMLRKKDALKIVKTHLPELLEPRYRSRKFFLNLKQYIALNKIRLTKRQTKLLEYNIQRSRFERVFHRFGK